jgi:hypothetical protein
VNGAPVTGGESPEYVVVSYFVWSITGDCRSSWWFWRLSIRIGVK